MSREPKRPKLRTERTKKPPFEEQLRRMRTTTARARYERMSRAFDVLTKRHGPHRLISFLREDIASRGLELVRNDLCLFFNSMSPWEMGDFLRKRMRFTDAQVSAARDRYGQPTRVAMYFFEQTGLLPPHAREPVSSIH